MATRLSEEEEDYVDDILEEFSDLEDDDEEQEDYIEGMVEVGAIDEVGATKVRGAGSMKLRAKMLKRLMMRKFRRRQRKDRVPPGAGPLPSPPFGDSERSTQRRAPLGFLEAGTGANFFTLLPVIGATTTMTGKVSRTAHADRLLIVPSDPGVVLESVKVGDNEQLLASGAPVELYSTAALTDRIPDNFSPLGPALDFVVTLKNTTVLDITGTIGIKASVKR